METRNIMVSLPADLVREAKPYAAQRHTTVSALVRELLQAKINRTEQVRAAAARILELADGGPYFTTDLGSIRRQDLYDRS